MRPRARPPVAESPARCASSRERARDRRFEWGRPLQCAARVIAKYGCDHDAPHLMVADYGSSVPLASPSMEPKFTVAIPSSMETMMPLGFRRTAGRVGAAKQREALERRAAADRGSRQNCRRYGGLATRARTRCTGARRGCARWPQDQEGQQAGRNGCQSGRR